jgi:nucleotide-binding universal stress UspA family protein
MRILLAVDGSPCSDAAVREVAERSWPVGTEVKVLSVIHTALPLIPDPLMFGAAAHAELLEQSREHAPLIVEKAAGAIRDKAPGLKVTTEVQEGSPKKLIVEEAERWNADLILIGSHGRGPVKRFVLGSVSHAVALHAPCSVEIVRCRKLLEEHARE